MRRICSDTANALAYSLARLRMQTSERFGVASWITSGLRSHIRSLVSSAQSVRRGRQRIQSAHASLNGTSKPEVKCATIMRIGLSELVCLQSIGQRLISLNGRRRTIRETYWTLANGFCCSVLRPIARKCNGERKPMRRHKAD